LECAAAWKKPAHAGFFFSDAATILAALCLLRRAAHTRYAANVPLLDLARAMNSPPRKPMLARRIRRSFDRFLNLAELAGLILIGLATAYAMAQEAWKVVLTGEVSLTDLLLMFLYLEVLAMNVRYLRLGHLPVRFPLYIAMVSLARDLILRGVSDDSPAQMLLTTFGIVLLAVGVLILRYGQHRFPMSDDEPDEISAGDGDEGKT